MCNILKYGNEFQSNHIISEMGNDRIELNQRNPSVFHFFGEMIIFIDIS